MNKQILLRALIFLLSSGTLNFLSAQKSVMPTRRIASDADVKKIFTPPVSRERSSRLTIGSSRTSRGDESSGHQTSRQSDIAQIKAETTTDQRTTERRAAFLKRGQELAGALNQAAQDLKPKKLPSREKREGETREAKSVTREKREGETHEAEKVEKSPTWMAGKKPEGERSSKITIGQRVTKPDEGEAEKKPGLSKKQKAGIGVGTAAIGAGVLGAGALGLAGIAGAAALTSGDEKPLPEVAPEKPAGEDIGLIEAGSGVGESFEAVTGE